jgi:hypothetical protein
MSVIKRVNTLNDTIRRKRGSNSQNVDTNNNAKVQTLSSTSASLLAQAMQQHHQQQQQYQQSQNFRSNLQHQSLTPQQFYNANNNNAGTAARISSLNDDVSQIKLISYKGIDTQVKDDEIRLKEVRVIDKIVSYG